MTKGTKSLLFGVHQFFWHPFTVLLAWIYLYGIPGWKELVCIFIHDWGYWGCENMDDNKGEMHPDLGASLAMKWFGPQWYVLCFYHSRHLSRKYGQKPSALCWADKLSIMFEPWWFYLPRALLSGELYEYRKEAKKFVPLSKTHREWLCWAKYIMVKIGKEKKATAAPYSHTEHPRVKEYKKNYTNRIF